MNPSIFFGSIFAVVGLFGFGRWVRVAKMKQWKPVKATIVKIEVKEVHGNQKGIPYVRYVPKVEYRYEVAGTRYVSNRFSMHNFTMGTEKNEILDLLHGAKEGDSIDAFFNPHKPSDVTLVMPAYDGVIVALFIGIGGLALVLTLSLAP
jgi:hypothetical protein